MHRSLRPLRPHRQSLGIGLAVIWIAGAVCAAGFHFGPTNAVKHQVKELDNERKREMVSPPVSPAPPPAPTRRRVKVPLSDLARVVTDPSRPYAYLSDVSLNVVHLLNTSTYEIDKSIFVGADPTEMDLKADGALLFVALSGGTQVAVVDLIAQIALTLITLPGSPSALAVGANDRLYVSLTSGAPIEIFDISSLPPVSVGTMAVGALDGRSADRTKLYTETVTGRVIQWDITGATPTQIQNTNVGSGTIIPSPDDTLFFILPSSGGDVSVHLASSLSQLGTFNVAGDAIALGIGPAGNLAYVAHQPLSWKPPDPEVHIFSTTTFVETGVYYLPADAKPKGITVGPDGRIYILMGSGSNDSVEIRMP